MIYVLYKMVRISQLRRMRIIIVVLDDEDLLVELQSDSEPS